MSDEKRAGYTGPRDPGSSRSVRWGVRVFFLTRKKLRLLSAGLVLVLAVVLFGVGVRPLGGRRPDSGARLQLVVDREGAARAADSVPQPRARVPEDRGEEHAHQMERIYLTYGMSTVESLGQGGYPYSNRARIDSIYSHAGQTAVGPGERG